MPALILQRGGGLKGFVQLHLEHTSMANGSCGLAPVFQALACDFIFFLAILFEIYIAPLAIPPFAS